MASETSDGVLAAEVARRRTFAIISHPDAGKTTLTEKLLLYGQAIQLAGSVKARKGARARSDWMEIEQKRGISITSTVLKFPYGGYVINLLDTPGHQDFSEDTYRTLTAADAAVMLIDAAKGVEAQTRKLFDVCKSRGVPIFTFVNKMDRPARDPFDLLDEIENILGVTAVPSNWPIGSGPEFRGVLECQSRQMHLFERTEHGAYAAPVEVAEQGQAAALLGEGPAARLYEEIDLIAGALPALDPAKVLAQKQTPVFFGSAGNNFGVELFLQRFLELAPPPGPAHTADGERIDPCSEEFAGFIFKIQANMSRSHRDRVAFLRICSGRFERGMAAFHNRSGQKLRLNHPHSFFASQRTVLDDAFPGDIIGLVNPGQFRVGDTLSSGRSVSFGSFPRFSPELFCRIRPRNPSLRKGFLKGIEQLGEEGTIQIFYPISGAREPILAGVGQLQFEVVQTRLESEYDVPTVMEPLNFAVARWMASERSDLGIHATLVQDEARRPVALFRSQFTLDYALKNLDDLELLEAPPGL